MSVERILTDALAVLVLVSIIGCGPQPSPSAEPALPPLLALPAPTPDTVGGITTTTLVQPAWPLTREEAFHGWFLSRRDFNYEFDDVVVFVESACVALRAGATGVDLVAFIADSLAHADAVEALTDIVAQGVAGHCPEQIERLVALPVDPDATHRPPELGFFITDVGDGLISVQAYGDLDCHVTVTRNGDARFVVVMHGQASSEVVANQTAANTSLVSEVRFGTDDAAALQPPYHVEVKAAGTWTVRCAEEV